VLSNVEIIETAALSLAVDNAPDDAALKVRFEAALNRFGGPEDYIIFSLAISLIGLVAMVGWDHPG
jgi:hypothetical protein